VGTLIKIHELMKTRGGKFYIFGMKSSLHTIFRLSGLLGVFNELDIEEAEKSYPELID
jgi:anti-anti-sigma regulatory factor